MAMEIDTAKLELDRSTRAASVLSGLSAEDMEAAETLNSLQQSENATFIEARVTSADHDLEYSPQQQQGPPLHVHTTTSFDQNQPEPLLRLFTSAYPLAGSLINGSLSAYKTTQSYIPLAEWTERNVGLPIAGKVARISGVEGGLRWVLKPKRDGKNQYSSRSQDVEKGYTDVSTPNSDQPAMEVAYTETLPAYSAGDRSPPYSERQLAVQSEQRQPPPGWGQQLVISTSGLGVAMSEESLRSLRFCLSWLRWANGRLGEAIQNIKALLERWNEGITPSELASPTSIAHMTQTQDDRRQAAMTARIAALRKDVLETLKQVVGIVSNYAGGALPTNARELVHRHLTSLPQRFQFANSMIKPGEADGNEAENSANRVMVLAQEGLDMMTQVSRVVNDTLVSAEAWCEKLGRKTGKGQQDQAQLPGAPPPPNGREKHPLALTTHEDERERSLTAGHDQDVKMEMS